jgi:ribose-phosphate pyrophosphokinase
MIKNIKLFSGSSNPALAQAIAVQLCIPLSNADIGRFSDGEILVKINENVRGREAYIIQSTSNPANEHLMELVLMIDALRRASAIKITAVIPYFGYARQDRRIRSARVPISARVVANMLASAGADRVVTVDLHSEQIQGFFDIPVDNVYATYTMFKDIFERNIQNPVVISPDVGGVVRARAIAKRLNHSDLAIIDKRRPKENEVEIMNIIGDVKNRHCIITDDIVDTAGTLCSAVKALKDAGAKTVTAYAIHAVLSGKAIENIENSVLDELVVTDTIPLSEAAKKCSKIRVLSVAELLAQTLVRINEKGSVSSLFD